MAVPPPTKLGVAPAPKKLYTWNFVPYERVSQETNLEPVTG